MIAEEIINQCHEHISVNKTSGASLGVSFSPLLVLYIPYAYAMVMEFFNCIYHGEEAGCEQ
jgi:hypothetical protein